jgi:hypothetical protein
MTRPLPSLWTVYERPADYPGGFVARRHVVDGKGGMVPTPEAFYGGSLDSVRDQLPPGLVMLARQPEDHPHIVEVWL